MAFEFSHFPYLDIKRSNPRRACAARVTSSVCLSVTATTRNKAAKKRYQRVQYHTGKNGDFRKSTAFKSYGRENQANKPIC